MASRFTFRDPAGDVAYQRQLRDRYAEEGAPSGVPHLDVGRSVVRPVSRRLAEQIILKYEWLGTMSNTSHHFGIFFGAYCAGVCCFGVAATAGAYVHVQYGVAANELATLARGACVHWAPRGANSRLVARACRLLAASSPARVVVAYADSDAGEVGTIYQACGWTYIGPSIRGGGREFVAPNGRIYNTRIAGILAKQPALRWRDHRDAMVAAGWRVQEINPKHRYVYVLDRSDRELVARVEAMRLPYPKREAAS